MQEAAAVVHYDDLGDAEVRRDGAEPVERRADARRLVEGGNHDG